MNHFLLASLSVLDWCADLLEFCFGYPELVLVPLLLGFFARSLEERGWEDTKLFLIPTLAVGPFSLAALAMEHGFNWNHLTGWTEQLAFLAPLIWSLSIYGLGKQLRWMPQTRKA